jgi:alpha-L-fucosidase
MYDAYRNKQMQPGWFHPDDLVENFVRGDFATPEGVGAVPKGSLHSLAWESCFSVGSGWGYHRDDRIVFKAPKQLVYHLVSIVSKGGNFLLNVGPTEKGEIQGAEMKTLLAMGKWLKVNGESIYGTGFTPFAEEIDKKPNQEPSGKSADILNDGMTEAGKKQTKSKVPQQFKQPWCCTTKPGKLYIHLFEWPEQNFKLSGVTQTVKQAYLLADPQRNPLHINQNETSVTVDLPAQAPDPIDSVLCIEIK